MATHRASRFMTTAELDNVGPETVSQYWDTVTGLAATYLRQPLATFLRDLPNLQEHVFQLLEGHQKPALTRDLYLLASLTSGLLAKASHDMRRPRDAMTHARTMFICADNAGHPGMKAWARGAQSLIAYWAGRPHHAIRYAQSGADLARDATGTVTIWLPALEARAWAALNRRGATSRALHRADTHRASHTPDDLDNIGGLLTFTPARQEYYAAGAHVRFPADQDHAQTAARNALDQFTQGRPEDRSFSDEAGARTELALSQAQLNDLTGLTDTLTPVLDLPPTHRIEGVRQSTIRIHQALSVTHLTQPRRARQVQEQIEHFCQTPAAALHA